MPKFERKERREEGKKKKEKKRTEQKSKENEQTEALDFTITDPPFSILHYELSELPVHDPISSHGFLNSQALLMSSRLQLS